MNETIQIFRNEQFGTIRTIEENGKVLFCGNDVAKALCYANPRKALGDHCRCVTKRYTPHPQSPEKTIEMSFIPEGDVFRLITHSKIPDRYNPNKAWLIKRYHSGNYYINQEICGKTFYNGFVRVTKKYIAELLGGKENKNG